MYRRLLNDEYVATGWTEVEHYHGINIEIGDSNYFVRICKQNHMAGICQSVTITVMEFSREFIIFKTFQNNVINSINGIRIKCNWSSF